MLESSLPRIASWLSIGVPRWRLSTWWPSDSRASMQRSLLRLLAVAHRQRLDVSPLVANFAEEHRGFYRHHLRRLSGRLSEGTPLVEALEQTPDVLTDEVVLALRFATTTGTLGRTYEYLVDEPHSAENRANSSLRQTAFYVIVTLLIAVAAIAFLVVFIVPTFEVLSRDFAMESSGTRTPWAYHALVGLGSAVVNHAPLLILVAIVTAWLVWSPTVRRYVRRAVATKWVRGVAQKRSAELLRMLSLAVEQGRPVPAALSTLARYHFDGSVRAKLMFARIEAEHRDDVWNILAEADLLTAGESTALAELSRDSSRVWAMRRLADRKLEQVARRSELRVAWLGPAFVLVLAAVVLLAGSSLIGFLSQMVQDLA